ncbi:hypothetical protein [Paenibacillus lutrae]|uniref:Uncharacterized protein n=1 Tax=Paenibacillus lutrae TaxID=2078573 RepID=A0A7X3JZP0_9BACL|nr:hypothetical protein [Paenibacillus lutrae]MVP00384.1 hypothetical protein [Paenibacillus lutrae]
MRSKTRCVIQRKGTDAYLNRRGDGLTGDLFAAIRFPSLEECSEWLLNCIYAPEDTENYECVEVEISIQIKQEV